MRTGAYLAPRGANHTPLSPLDLLERTVAVYPDRPAVVWKDASWNWAEFDVMVQRMVAMLEERGIGTGDVVSVIAGNRPEMLAAHFAVPTLGAVLNTINTRLDPETIGYILDHSGARLLLCDPASVGLAVEAAGVPVLCMGGEPVEGTETFDFLAPNAPPARRIDWRAHVTDEWQPIALNYTSGTTGRPKAVVLHHRGAHQNAIGNVFALGFGRDTKYLWTLPLFHCNGWSHGWAVTAAAGTHVCLDGVDPEDIFTAIEDQQVTHFCCAPVVLYMLLNHPARAARDATAPRVSVATGGAAPTSSLIEQLDELGFDLTHLYGLTESYGPVTLNQLSPEQMQDSPSQKAALLTPQGKRHMTGNTLAVVTEAGSPVPRDGKTMGEIVLKGNTLMAGYLNDEAETETAFEGGWFHTGDLAVMHPNGQVEIRDRAKDIIISGGENVSSLEIEDALHRHPAVLLAAVVAAPHPKWGEVPCAFIELKDGSKATSDDITAFCREHLAGFKLPRQIVFDELPKTATGKVQKFLLRARAADLAVVRK